MLKLLEALFDLQMLTRFKADAQRLWKFQGAMYQDVYGVARQKLQGTITVERRLEPNRSYQAARRRINHSVLRAIDLARVAGVPVDMVSLPPSHMRGPKRAVNILQAITNDEAYGGVNHRTILDAIDQIVGYTRRQLRREFVRLLNPFAWAGDVVTILVRLPFFLLVPAGINIRRLEKTWWGITLKMVLTAAWVVGPIYLYVHAHPHAIQTSALMHRIKQFQQFIWPA